MWCITYHGKPATLEKIYNAEGRAGKVHQLDAVERVSYAAAPTRNGAIAIFLHHVGFTWKERHEGIGVDKMVACVWQGQLKEVRHGN